MGVHIRGVCTLAADKCPVTYEQWSVHSSAPLGIRTKRTSHFRNELPEDRVPSKYSGNMLITSWPVSCGIAPVSTIATIASLPSRFTLSRAFVPFFFFRASFCPGFQACPPSLSRVSARNAMRRRLHSFPFFFFSNPLTFQSKKPRIQC